MSQCRQAKQHLSQNRRQLAELRYQMTHSLIWLLMVVGLFVVISSLVAVAGDQKVSPHGDIAHLQHDVFRDPELHRHLDQARLAVREGRIDAAIELLDRILSEPADSFVIDDTGQSVHSIKSTATQLLATGTAELRIAWQRQMDPQAKIELEAALSARDQSALQLTCRRFPFTASGVRAAVLSIIDQRQRGEHSAAQSAASDWEHLYRYHPAFYAPFERLRAVYERVSVDGVRRVPVKDEAVDRSHEVRHVRLSIEVPKSHFPLSIPWPEPLWNWEESAAGRINQQFTQYPADFQQNHPLYPFDHVQDIPLGEFSNWTPLVIGDMLVFRSPRQLVGFRKLTGERIWYLEADTSMRHWQPSESGSISPVSSISAAVSDGSIVLRSNYGLLATDEQSLYFVDHFRTLRQLRDGSDVTRRARPDWPLRHVLDDPADLLAPEQNEELAAGSRLVALRFDQETSIPEVAWTLGTSPTAPYAIQVPAALDGRESSGGDAKDRSVQSVLQLPFRDAAGLDREYQISGKAGEFQGHQFLSPPAGRGSYLFLLTATIDRVWVNCIHRNDGRLIWRQPVVYDQDLLGQRLLDTPDPGRSDVCLIVEDMLVCSLSSGLLTGLRPADGRLVWATSPRDPQLQTERFALLEPGPSRISPAAFLPAVSGSTVICSNVHTQHVYAVSAATGRILWQVPREPRGPGSTAGSADLYVVHVTANQVIMMGTRHCRALDLTTGEQLWIVEVSEPTGRAWCEGERCLIPESDGRVVMIDTKRGQPLRVSQELLPQNSVGHPGALVGDQDIVAICTAESLSVFARADTVLRKLNQLDALRTNPVEQQLVQAQASLLAGDRDAAMDVLTAAVTRLSQELLKTSGRESAHADSLFRLHRFAAELILQDAGRRLLGGTQLQRADRSSRQAAIDQLQSDLLHLPELSLTTEEQLRLQLLQTLASPQPPGASSDLPDLVPPFRVDQLVTIDGDWRTQVSLLLDAEDPARRLRLWQQTSGSSSLYAHIRPEAMESLILNPFLAGNPETLQLAIRQLMDINTAAAELLVLSRLRQSEGLDSGTAAMLRTMLRQIRDQPRTDTSRDLRSWQSEQHAVNTYTIRQQMMIRTTDPFSSEISQFQTNIGFSQSEPLIWRARSEYTGGTVVAAFDPDNGSQTDEVSIPFSVIGWRTGERSEMAPRLALVSGANDIGMVTAVRPGIAELLWHIRVREVPLSGIRGVLPGPVGSDYAVWQTDRRLHCSHPLTGRLLWSRDCPQPPPHSGRAPRVQLFGDELLTMVVDADNQRYRQYRTRDGALIHTGILPIRTTTGNSVLTIGRKLMSISDDERLSLFDPLKQMDVLTGLPADSRFSVNSPLLELSAGRVVTVSRRQEIVVVDTHNDCIQLHLPVSQLMNTQSVFSLTAFELGDRLFVGLNDEKGFNRRFQALPQLGESRVDYGRLFCIDLPGGELKWSIRTEPAVIMSVHGDVCPLLIGWSHVEENRAVFGEYPSHGRPALRIQVFDLTTGDLVAERSGLAPEFPLRGVHDAAAGETRIFLTGSIITISSSGLQTTENCLEIP